MAGETDVVFDIANHAAPSYSTELHIYCDYFHNKIIFTQKYCQIPQNHPLLPLYADYFSLT
jgi:hypothetical protein